MLVKNVHAHLVHGSRLLSDPVTNIEICGSANSSGMTYPALTGQPVVE